MIRNYFSTINVHVYLGVSSENAAARKIVSEVFKDAKPVEAKTDAVFSRRVKCPYPDDFCYDTVFYNVYLSFFEDTVRVMGNYTYSELMKMANDGKIVITDYNTSQLRNQPDTNKHSILRGEPSTFNFAYYKDGLLSYCRWNNKIFNATKQVFEQAAKQNIKNAEQQNTLDL